jgi:cyclophilin family peptidyl-prolyl cis-trans isomerase
MRMARYLSLAILLGVLSASPVLSQEKKTMVVIDTSMGPIKVELFQDKAPITVKNFLQYVDGKHYDKTIFHRVISNFMIQGGGFDSAMGQKPTKAPIKNESSNGLSNARGTLAMARTNVPDSATAQFFINVADNTFLDKAGAQDGVGYCVFGKVVEGMDVVDKIRGVKTTTKQNHENVPEVPVVIESVRRVDNKK